MCTTGYDSQTNTVIDFLKEMYLPDLLKVNNYLWFSVSQGKVVLDTYHFANFEMRADDKKYQRQITLGIVCLMLSLRDIIFLDYYTILFS